MIFDCFFASGQVCSRRSELRRTKKLQREAARAAPRADLREELRVVAQTERALGLHHGPAVFGRVDREDDALRVDHPHIEIADAKLADREQPRALAEAQRQGKTARFCAFARGSAQPLAHPLQAHAVAAPPAELVEIALEIALRRKSAVASDPTTAHTIDRGQRSHLRGRDRRSRALQGNFGRR